MNRIYTLFLLISIMQLGSLAAQQVITHTFQLNWSNDNPLRFDDAGEFSADPRLPVYTFRFPISGPAELDLQVSAHTTESFPIHYLQPKPDLPRHYITGGVAENERGKWFGRIWLVPVVANGSGEALKILSGEISIRLQYSSPGGSRSGPMFKENSVLANGVNHKISVDKPGVYRIDHSFIKDKLKVDPATIHPDRFALYSNGGGRIPESNSIPRVDDLSEVRMYSVGMEDGKIDAGDYFLWYAEGPDRWTFSPEEGLYHMDKNIYDNFNHFYIIINGPTRSAMPIRPNGTAANYVSTTSLHYQRLEEEKVNLLGRFRAPGAGQDWYGDELSATQEINYTQKFDLSSQSLNDSVAFSLRFAARAGKATKFHVYFDQQEFNKLVGSVQLVNFESDFANDAIIQGKFKPSAPINQIRVRYPDANGINSRAWLDYLELNLWKENRYISGKPFFIRDPKSLKLGTPSYDITGVPSGAFIWDITDPFNPVMQQYASGTVSNFIYFDPASTKPSEFVVFHPASDVSVPIYRNEVANQNLHSIQRADMLIIYYDEFESAAQRLAGHRQSHSHLNVVAVPVSKVFEEFGGGSQDPSAIRDFARVIYSRDPGFRFLLLIGDATYDYLNRFTDLPYHNFIPAWETQESLHPVFSFPSDDYFALLDENEGHNLKGALDLGVGRLPVASLEEANAMVEKLIHYDTSPRTLNDWRQRVVYIADDQDSNTHLRDADGLTVMTMAEHPNLNINKLYLDAYPQVSTPGGDRYPEVNADIDLNVKKGALAFTYMGHGGPNGLAQERIIGINQVKSYDNIDNMPLFITATCSFAGYDDPSFKSAGEHLLTNPNGGAVALMTTVRAVYAGENERLTRKVTEFVYKSSISGGNGSISDVLRNAKNIGVDTSNVNARKFTLLGDPAMKLALPKYKIEVTQVNGIPVNENNLDTLSALEKATISGQIVNDQGDLLSDFNGKIFLTVYDKLQVRKTLSNDHDSPERTFVTQNRQLFKGAASVNNGQWTIEFVLPKDLDFSYGNGKMSFYAHNHVEDAAGYFTSFIIGGVSPEGLADDQPPVIRLYMNDENFVSGGITDAKPDIFMILTDDNGINVSGTGVGHDIEAILDGDDGNSIILNDFYQSSVDNYRSGEVRYPLSGLTAGKHTLKVTAWDLANNPAEAYLEFIVLDEGGGVLRNVFNYPNPFTTSTHFQFEHNRPGVEMNFQIQIYTITGRLVKSIGSGSFISEGYRIADIPWDGLDDSGGQLAKGVYVYKVRATYRINGRNEIVESKAEKLVILR